LRTRAIELVRGDLVVDLHRYIMNI